MSPPPICIEMIRAAHDVRAFTCGVTSLDVYLHKHARTNVTTGYAQTFVAVEQGSTRVVGYFSLSATSIETKTLPPSELTGMPRYPVPGVLLAKLASDVTTRGDGRRLGEVLLLEALRSALAGGQHIGWRFLVVDAIDENAVKFYRKYGFVALPDTPLRLYMSAGMARQTVQLFAGAP